MDTTTTVDNIKLGLDYIFFQWIAVGLGVAGLLFAVGFLLLCQSQFMFSLRNVFRNKRRSLITLLAIMSAVCGNVLVGTYFLRMFQGLREFNIRSQTGHVQYMKKNFYEKGASDPTNYLIDNAQDIINTLADDKELAPYIDLITVQTRFNGLITAGDKSISFIGNAVEPGKDTELSAADIYVAGSPLSENKPYSIVLGEGLASQLDVKIGDSVVLLSTIAGGGLNALDATVGGIMRPLAKDYSDVIVKTGKEFANQMLYTEGSNKIIVLLNDTKDTAAAKAVMRRIAGNHPEWGVRLYDWYQLQDFYRQVVRFFSSMFTVVSTLLFFLVVFLVLNTMVMSVFERFNEFGTLRSIGVKKRRLVNMVLIEGVILGFSGAVLGIIMSYVIGQFVTGLNIEIAPPPGQSRGHPLNIVPANDMVTMQLIIISALSSVGMAFISSLFPALKATKLKMVDALRHN